MSERCRIESRVAGIPCQISVSFYLNAAPYSGPARYCDSPDDYFGYCEVEFSVLDQRGRPAPWLGSKLKPSDRERIELEVVKHMEESRYDD